MDWNAGLSVVGRSRAGFWLALLAIFVQLAAPVHCASHKLAPAARLTQFSPFPGFELSICGRFHLGQGQTDQTHSGSYALCLMCCAIGHFGITLPEPALVMTTVALTGTMLPAPDDPVLAQTHFGFARSRAPPVSI